MVLAGLHSRANQSLLGQSPYKFMSAPAASNVAEKAFALQYTSVIIIILAFVLGSFAKPFLPSLIIETEQPVAIKKVGTVTYTNLFQEGSAVINSVAAESLVQFAKAHDIDLTIKVYADHSMADLKQMTALALARSVDLYRFMIKAGLPINSIKVRAEADKIDIQASVQVDYSPGASYEE